MLGSLPDSIKERKEEYRRCGGYRRNNNAIVVLNPEYVPHSFVIRSRGPYICNTYENRRVQEREMTAYNSFSEPHDLNLCETRQKLELNRRMVGVERSFSGSN